MAARRSCGRLVAYLAARSRDVAGAEDALADAFEAALARWPAGRRARQHEAEGLLRLAASHGRPGRYQLEAAVQSAHLEGLRRGRVDWAAIEHLYAALCELSGSTPCRPSWATTSPTGPRAARC